MEQKYNMEEDKPTGTSFPSDYTKVDERSREVTESER